MHLSCTDMKVIQYIRSFGSFDSRGNHLELIDPRSQKSDSFFGELLLVGECKSKKWNEDLHDMRARGLLLYEDA